MTFGGDRVISSLHISQCRLVLSRNLFLPYLQHHCQTQFRSSASRLITLSSRVMASETMEPFAIVGLSFRMPQEAVDEAGLWKVLESGENLMTEWPENRANVEAFYDGGSRKQNTVSTGEFLFRYTETPC